MDPLSIVASVAGLVSLSAEASKIIGEYYTSAKNASKDVQDIKTELESLSIILQRLELLLRSDKMGSKSISFDNSSVLNSALISCETIIKEVTAKLQRSNDSSAARMWERLKWPFSEKEVQKLLETLHAYIHTFQFALTVEGCNVLSKTSDNVSISLEVQLETSRKVYELTKNVAMMTASAQEASRLSEQVTQILKLISTFHTTDLKLEEISHDLRSLAQSSQDQKKHHDVRASRVPGTGQWLLDHAKFHAWLKDDAELGVLFLVGDPGVGKSVLTSLMVDKLLETYSTGGAGVAYFYFDYRAQDLQTPNQFLATILRQLSTQTKTSARLLADLYDKCRTDRSQVAVADLLQVCKDIRRLFASCLIVIDALDESDNKRHRKCILDILEALELAQFKLVITSRPHPQDIERRFRKAAQIRVTACEADIMSFCISKIDDNEDIRDLIDDKLRDDILSTMSTNAQGMFLLPVLQMQTIAHQMTKSEIRRCLRNFSTDLHQVFEDNIGRILREPPNRKHVAVRSLMWITHARRPLNIDELRHALATRLEDKDLDGDNLIPARSIIECCSGLVVLDDESSTFRLVHSTLQEYLISLKTNLFPSADNYMTSVCLTYLCFDCFINQSTSQETLNRMIEEYSFLRYASFHWGYHANNARDDETAALVMKYLTDKSKSTLSRRIRNLTSPRFGQLGKTFGNIEEGGCLHTVAYFGLDHLVEPIILNGEDVNTYDSFGNTALHEAAVNSHYMVAKALLQNRAEVDARNLEESTPIFLAASRSQHDLLELLLNHSASPNNYCTHYWTPLHKASDSGQYLNVKLLLKHGASILAETGKGLTALHRAAGRGHIEIVDLLLKENAPVDSQTFDKWTPLAGASSSGRHEVVKLLLANGASVDSAGADGRTPLHRACRGGYGETVLALLEGGADTLVTDEHRHIPLHLAAKGGHTAVAKILIHRGHGQVFVKNAWGYTAQQEAFYGGHWETARFLREEEMRWLGASPEKPDELTCAIESHDLSKVKVMLEQGFDVNRRNSERLTPLHQALQKNALQICLALLESGADIEAETPDGWRPLHCAARSGLEAPVRLCLDYKADWLSSTADGQTALHKACQSNNFEAVRVLLEKGSNIEAKDIRKFTPLLTAAASGHETIVKILLDKGANIEARSIDGDSAQGIAADAGHHDLVELLREQAVATSLHQSQEIRKSFPPKVLSSFYHRKKKLMNS